MMKFSICFVVVSSLLPIRARAEITVLREYLMGDADPSVVLGDSVVSSRDGKGGANLVVNGSVARYRAVDRPAFGKFGRAQTGIAVEFDGNSFFTAPGLPELVDNFGVEAWVQSTGGTLVVSNGSSVDGWSLLCTHTGRSTGFFSGTDLDGIEWAMFGTAATPVGQWHHIALVRDRGLTRVYVNGVFESPVPRSVPPIPSTSPLQIGYGPGLIDEVRIFSFLPGQFRTTDLSYPMDPTAPLEIATLSGGNVDLRWPGTKFKRVVETTTDLQSGVWSVLADETTPMENAYRRLSSPLTGQQRFYRLNRIQSTEWKGRVGVGVNVDTLFYDLFAEVDASSVAGRSARVGTSYSGLLEQGFNASQSIDPATGDSTAIAYQWEIFAPLAYVSQLSAQSLGRLSGISGLQSSTIRFAPNSLPRLNTIGTDPEATWWRMKLTMRHEPFIHNSPLPQQKVYWFRFRYAGSMKTINEASAELQLMD